jgi:hypothetical protein
MYASNIYTTSTSLENATSAVFLDGILSDMASSTIHFTRIVQTVEVLVLLSRLLGLFLHRAMHLCHFGGIGLDWGLRFHAVFAEHFESFLINYYNL